jgi:predicted aminopeptidase
VAGCVNYRGYFAETEARREAARLQAEGQDVFVSGVPAYSTLGYFDDPVLSTFIRWPDIDVARMVFHELAHQVAYAKDDTQFNESFAVAVEEVGLARWLQAQGNPLIKTQFTRSQNLRARFSDLTRETRARLVAVYSSNLPDEEKRRAKAEAFTEMREGYERAKAGEPGLAGYDRWFAGYANAGPNNAGLSSISLYSVNVPAFRALLTRDGGNLPRFYATVKALAAKPKYERDAVLANALKPEIETASVAAQ